MSKKSVKKKRFRYIFGIIFIMLCAIVLFLFLAKYLQRQKAETQMELAGKYLTIEDYKSALSIYQEALTLKENDYEEIMLGMSSCYVGLKEYENALITLREAYEKVGSDEIKKEIETVTILQKDYDYDNWIKRGQTYESNNENDKAIVEYEKAKQIKPKEVLSYEKIAQCYLKLNLFEEARNEVSKGEMVGVDSQILRQIVHRIDYLQNIDAYNKILEETKELEYQENYAAAMTNYNEAIELLPYQEDAYLGLAQVYCDLKQYDSAIQTLNNAQKIIQSKTIDEHVNLIKEMSDKLQVRKDTLKELYQLARNKQLDEIIEIMQTEEFRIEFQLDYPVYYSEVGEGIFGDGYGMTIYNQGHIYIGDFVENKRRGSGFNLKWWKESEQTRFCTYNGEWLEDAPNGYGTVKEVGYLDGNLIYGELYSVSTVGFFVNGLENDIMTKEIKDSKGESIGSVSYKASMGVVQPLTDEYGTIRWVYEDIKYIYGEVVLNQEPTGYFLSTTPTTIMQVNY